MIIKAFDQDNDLFVVENFYPENLLQKLSAIDHLSTDWRKQDWQDHLARRRLIPQTDSIYTELDFYVSTQLEKIQETINVELMCADTVFWLDEAGFSMTRHLDNDGVKVSMQLYLNENIKELGTVFYNKDKTVRYRSDFTLNHGYIMINGPEQVHGMGVSVPLNTYRLSSYSWFYPKV